MDTRFHCVYLLTSLDPACDGDYYIGYTVNPLRRLRQHNGDLVNGAQRTSRRGRPWTIVCCVSGFTEDRAALKFEWCWQHPTASARLKHTLAAAGAALRGLRKLPYAVAMLHLLLHANLFSRLDLTLHVFEQEIFSAAVSAATARRPRVPATATAATAAAAAAPSAVPAHRADSGRDGGIAGALPPLVETALFHVEYTSREEFQRRHLDPTAAAAAADTRDGGGGAGRPSFADSVDVSSIVPCEASVLSQAAGDGGGGRGGDSSGLYGAPEDGETTVMLRLADTGADTATGAPEAAAAVTARVALRAALLPRGALPCALCGLPLRAPQLLCCPRAPRCEMRAHVVCLGLWAQYRHHTAHDAAGAADAAAPDPSHPVSPPPPPLLVPSLPVPCPLCAAPLRWAALVKDLKRRAAVVARARTQRRHAQVDRRIRCRLEEVQHEQRQRQRRRLRGRPQRTRTQATDGKAEESPPPSQQQRRRRRARLESPDAVHGGGGGGGGAAASGGWAGGLAEETSSPVVATRAAAVSYRAPSPPAAPSPPSPPTQPPAAAAPVAAASAAAPHRVQLLGTEPSSLSVLSAPAASAATAAAAGGTALLLATPTAAAGGTTPPPPPPPREDSPLSPNESSAVLALTQFNEDDWL